MTSYKIKDFFIGDNEKCFIIAEIGVNHNGSLDLAKKMIVAAKECGADAVKFQTFNSEQVCTNDADMENYQIENSGEITTQMKMLKKLELSHEAFLELKNYCNKQKIIFLSTPHSDDAIPFLNPNVPLFKLESGDVTNHPRLKKVAATQKIIILSTGMCTLDEVKDAVKIIENEGNKQIILLQCTSLYPCLPSEVNLCAMVAMRKEINYPVGYSDHTMGIHASIVAVALGATIIEKHFTLDRSMHGPDHKASIEPVELKEMVKQVRAIEKVPHRERLGIVKQKIPNFSEYLGESVKRPTQRELDILKTSRKSVISAVPIHRNDIISESMLCIKRPGTGIEPTTSNLSYLIGKTARREIPKDMVLSWDMFEGNENEN